MDCVIDIKRLGSGSHKEEFTLDGSFFSSFSSDTITDANIKVAVSLTKAAGWIKVDCDITGDVEVECDRCLAELRLPVDISAPFTVKFSDIRAEGEEYGQDVVILDKNDGELDLSQIIYDYVCLSLPIKRVHSDGECDPVMMERMKEILK